VHSGRLQTDAREKWHGLGRPPPELRSYVEPRFFPIGTDSGPTSRERGLFRQAGPAMEPTEVSPCLVTHTGDAHVTHVAPRSRQAHRTSATGKPERVPNFSSLQEKMSSAGLFAVVGVRCAEA
jgi:hypothetical protein